MRRAVAPAVFASVVFGVLLALAPVSRTLLVHAYVLVLAGLVLAALVAALPTARSSAFDAALRRPRPQEARPPQLERVERNVTLGVANAFDFHLRLRPLLRDAAAARLAAARGVDLDGPAGRAAVGEEAWELLRPDREPPDDRFAAGIPEQRLRRLVDVLETL